MVMVQGSLQSEKGFFLKEGPSQKKKGFERRAVSEKDSFERGAESEKESLERGAESEKGERGARSEKGGLESRVGSLNRRVPLHCSLQGTRTMLDLIFTPVKCCSDGRTVLTPMRHIQVEGSTLALG